ncbi:hypothetical protein V8F33_003576 [Rhypophila sp. PSN 637]
MQETTCKYQARWKLAPFLQLLGLPRTLDCLGEDLLPLLSKCPRSAAERVVRRVEENYGITMKLGFELEFVLSDASLEPARPIDDIAGASLTAGLRGAILDAVEQVIVSME